MLKQFRSGFIFSASLDNGKEIQLGQVNIKPQNLFAHP